MTALKSAMRAGYRRLARSRFAPILHLSPIRRVHEWLTATRVSDADVVGIVRLLGDARVEATLLGGWACDALLGRQTREHGDVDLLVQEADSDRALMTLEREGFERIYTFDSPLLAARVVELTDHRTRRCASLHFADLDSRDPSGFQGLLRARLADAGFATGELFEPGVVAGRQVTCLSAPAQLVLRILCPPSESRRRDLELLSSRFSLPVPDPGGPVTNAA